MGPDRTYLGRDLTDGELREARGLLTASGSRRFVEELADARLDEARAISSGLGMPADLMGAVVAASRRLRRRSEVAA